MPLLETYMKSNGSPFSSLLCYHWFNRKNIFALFISTPHHPTHTLKSTTIETAAPKSQSKLLVKSTPSVVPLCQTIKAKRCQGQADPKPEQAALPASKPLYYIQKTSLAASQFPASFYHENMYLGKYLIQCLLRVVE